MLTLDQFRATRRYVADLRETENGDYYETATPGYIYVGGCWIEALAEPPYVFGPFHLIIAQSEWTSTNLAELEEILYREHAVPEGCCDQQELTP